MDVCEEGEGKVLEAFVRLFDPQVARDALKSVFVTRKAMVSEIEFDRAPLLFLSSSSALLLRKCDYAMVETF